MKTAVVFAGKTGIDFESIRWSSLRIPEVSQVFREAQSVIDQNYLSRPDLSLVMNSDTDQFRKSAELRDLCQALVQLAMYKRFSKSKGRPDYLIASKGERAILPVVLGEKTLLQLVREFLGEENTNSAEDADEARVQKTAEPAADFAATLIKGQDPVSYALYQKSDLTFKEMPLPLQDAWTGIVEVVEYQGVRQVVQIAPHFELEFQKSKDRHMLSFDLIDSVEVDPHLSWFFQNKSQVKFH